MEVSDTNAAPQAVSDHASELDGNQLLETVVSLTGLPGEMVDQELRGLLAVHEQDAASLTLDGLRAVMLAYLESVQKEMTEGLDSEEVAVVAALEEAGALEH